MNDSSLISNLFVLLVWPAIAIVGLAVWLIVLATGSKHMRVSMSAFGVKLDVDAGRSAHAPLDEIPSINDPTKEHQ